MAYSPQPMHNRPVRRSIRLNPQLFTDVQCSYASSTTSFPQETEPCYQHRSPLKRQGASDIVNQPNTKRRRLTHPRDTCQIPLSTITPEDKPDTLITSARKKKQVYRGAESTKRAKSDTARLEGGTVNAVAYWATHKQWPVNFAAMSQSSSSRKRPQSYSRSFRDGGVPRAHTSKYETELAINGIHMQITKGKELVNDQSKVRADKFLKTSYPEPEYTARLASKFTAVWEHAQRCNEARLYRDITPLLIPSPELLYISGLQEFEHIAEDISVSWSNCKTLGGTTPRPDTSIGIASTAFTEQQIVKLKNHTSFERQTKLGEVYFPFLLVEVKCGEESIVRADRQNMHSASIAVDAIFQLQTALGSEAIEDLNGQDLVYSISHDNERVKFYGHFAITDGVKPAFYRHLFASFQLDLDGVNAQEAARNVVQAIYTQHFPEHLARIRKILDQMPHPQTISITSSMSFSEADSQELDTASSQGTVRFRQPDTPVNKRLKGDTAEVALLREQLAEEQRQSLERQGQLDLITRQLAAQEEIVRETRRDLNKNLLPCS